MSITADTRTVPETLVGARPTPIRSILVPIDYSQPAFRAAAVALTLANGLGASLTLLHLHIADSAIRETLHVDADDIGDLTPEHLRVLLMSLVGDASADSLQALVPHSRSEFERSSYSRNEVILDYAARHHVDLIVMGAKMHSKLHDALLGNIARSVIDAAPCPVMVTH